MDSLIFSLNATIPVFVCMVAGYFFRRIKMLNEDFVTVANKFNYVVTLPALLFLDISTANIKEVFDGRYVLYCMIVTSVCFWGMWGLTKLLMKDKSMRGAFVQASFRGSAAVLGVALIQNIYGDSGMAPLMIVGSVPLYNIYSVIVLTFESNGTDDKNMKSAFINICKNPIIISIFAGLIMCYLEVPLAPMVQKSIENFAKMATPLALVCIGAAFEGKKAITKIKPTIMASMVKLVLQPAIFLPVAIGMGFRDAKLIAILIMLGAPTTASCYIMAKNTNNDGVLTSSIVVVTTILSAITITGWLFILKTMAYI